MLILLTDGNDTGSRMPPRKAAEIAKQNKSPSMSSGSEIRVRPAKIRSTTPRSTDR